MTTLKPVRTLGAVVQAALGFHVALSLAGVAIGGRALGVAGRLAEGPVAASEVEPLLQVSDVLVVLSVVAAVVTALLFGLWLGRCYERVESWQGAGLPDSAWMARWGWAIPIVGVFVWPAHRPSRSARPATPAASGPRRPGTELSGGATSSPGARSSLGSATRS